MTGLWDIFSSTSYFLIMLWTLIVTSGFPCSSVITSEHWKSVAMKNWVAAATAAKSLQSCPILYDPIDGSPPGSPVPGILQARTLEWVAISFSSAWKWKWSCSVVPTLSDPMDCSLPGPSVHGIFQARVLRFHQKIKTLCQSTVWVTPYIVRKAAKIWNS